MDERWAEPTVAELVDRSIAIYGELFARVVEDLTATTRSRVVIAEGPGVLPWSVAPLADLLARAGRVTADCRTQRGARQEPGRREHALTGGSSIPP